MLTKIKKEKTSFFIPAVSFLGQERKNLFTKTNGRKYVFKLFIVAKEMINKKIVNEES
jgi:hypothetical protein